MDWYLAVLKNYVGFGGRARRKEYWMFTLFNVIAVVVLAILDAVLGISFLVSIYVLATLLPSLAVSIRRLHDTNRSGWWILIGLVPFIGSIILIIFAAIEGDQGENQYGANPKALPAGA